MMKLYLHPLSSYCWKVEIAFYESGIPFEPVMVNPGNPEAVWFRGTEERSRDPLELDFRVGGREHASGVSKNGTRHTYDALYLDIVRNERFILTYWMNVDGVPISTSLQTVEFASDGAGALLTFTEQDAFLDGFDGPDSREEGTRLLPEQLAHAIDG